MRLSNARPQAPTGTTPALLVDLYQLTMLEAYRREGMAARPATFSLFVRSQPADWGYLVAAGLDDCLSWLEKLEFSDPDLRAIERLGLFPPDFLPWLSQLRFTGSVRAVPEGTLLFGGEPILEVDAPIAEAQLAETFLLNQVTLQTGLATQAARCLHAAQGRAVTDFALRRAPGVDAGMKLARCCRIVGINATSNVAGADRYGLAVSGTMAHSFVQAHLDEVGAFRAFARAFREQTVLLVDTYDTPRGIERAALVAEEMRREGIELHGIRIDSGDLGADACLARRRLDDAGFPEMKIFVSGGLDEYRIQELVERQHAPIDGFGVGTSLGAGGEGPTMETVYKLVSYDGHPSRKTSAGKATWPGAKQVWRDPHWAGDYLALADDQPSPADALPLLETVMRDGQRSAEGRRSLAEAHQHFADQWGKLPEPFKALSAPPRYPVVPSQPLQRLAEELDAHQSDRTDEVPALPH
jgi:nicotinate phosphoribosyltransferase